MPTMSPLDSGQVIKSVYDATNQALQVNAVAGSINVNAYDVIATYQVSGSTINGSGGAIVQLVASTSAAVKEIMVYDTTGIGISLFTGAAGFEVEKLKWGPGQDGITPCVVAASTRLSLRGNTTTAGTAGTIYITLLG